MDLPTALGAGVLATFVPLYVGLFAPRVLTKGRSGQNTARLLAAASAGIIFWFFLDVMGDAALLDVNQGLNAQSPGQVATHILLAILFAAGLTLLWSLERYSRPRVREQEESGSSSSSIPSPTFAVAMVAALGVGFHALGEGVAIGSILPQSSSILDAIGGLLPGVAYVLHKFLEGFVIGVFAVLAGAASERKIGLLGVIAGIPTILGFVVGLPSVLESSYFFALGGAGAMYIEIKLVPVFARTRLDYASIIFVLLGFYSMYIAGLFHG